MKKISRAKTPETGPVYKTGNDLPEVRRAQIGLLLNLRLADAVDLQSQLKQAHWNVKGPNFIGLHDLFDKITAAAGAYADLIAERVVQLGGIAEGTVRAAAAHSLLEEYPLAISDGVAHVDAVVKALSAFGHAVRGSITEADDLDDAGTADIFTEVSRGTDKWLWFVEAHVQAQR